MSTAKLTPKQAAFAREYPIDLNATAAAKRAGYSERTAYSQGQRLLKNAEIQKAIQAAQAEAAERASVTVQDVLDGLRREAENESYGSSHSARVSAWAHLGKHLGMFTDKLDVTSGGEPLRVLVEYVDRAEGEP